MDRDRFRIEIRRNEFGELKRNRLDTLDCGHHNSRSDHRKKDGRLLMVVDCCTFLCTVFLLAMHPATVCQ